MDGCSPQQAEGWLEYRIDDQEEWTMGYFAISVGMMAEMMAREHIVVVGHLLLQHLSPAIKNAQKLVDADVDSGNR